MHRHRLGLSTLAAVSLALAPQVAESQSKQHQGFWLGVGAGGGVLSGERGGAGYLRMGGTPNQQVLFGGEIIGWVRSEGDVERSQGNIGAVALYYPWQSNEASLSPSKVREFFIKGGFGAATIDVDDDTQTSGLGLTLGVGFDFRLGKNFYVTPNLDLLQQFFKDRTDTAVLISLGFTWH